MTKPTLSGVALHIDHQIARPNISPPDTRDGIGAIEMDALSRRLDDAMLTYVLAVRPAFDLLRAAVGQTAALLVLALASGRGVAGHPMLLLAQNGYAEAVDNLSGVVVPATAVHHHLHLVKAADAANKALTAASRCSRSDDDEVVDVVQRALAAAYQELNWAGAALPGFEMVSLAQGCCASHLALTDRILLPAGAAHELAKGFGAKEKDRSMYLTTERGGRK